MLWLRLEDDVWAETVTSRVGYELERCRARLFGYALSLTGDREAADDLLQDCALRALAATSVPESEAAFRAWLFRILRNAWIDQCRRQRRVVSLAELEKSVVEDAASWTYDRSLVDTIAVKQALGRLQVPYREVLSLVDLVGFSYGEVAQILGVPIGTVMSRLSRARKALLAEIASAQLQT